MRQFAQSTLTATAKGYDDHWQSTVRQAAPEKAFDVLKDSTPVSTLRDVVRVINKEPDLNSVSLAFLAFRDMTGQHVKMFDFDAVNS